MVIAALPRVPIAHKVKSQFRDMKWIIGMDGPNEKPINKIWEQISISN